jgi:micrococcal nuclease
LIYLDLSCNTEKKGEKEEKKEEKEEKEEEKNEKKMTVEEDKQSVYENERCEIIPSDRYLYHCELDKETEPGVKEKEKEKEKDIRTIYQQCTEENTPVYTYKNLKILVKVLRVVDGDTVDICLLHEETGKTFKHRVRLYGIDTPEKRPLKSNPNRDKEIAAAKLSTQAMKDKMVENDHMVIALFYDPDKYGRLLCTFYGKDGEDINQWMIDSGHAYSYLGKTKKAFEEKEE